ncbi:N-acetylglucosamine-6-phosphate deacetylase [Solibacillus sp. FSL K6-4121]|uniref:N-acetylglucosamine-6-phosphate deacetylase n=1 Tax=Solibacillus sp. FSL K6-4121 TaxID=2921505 RepID=UPI0030F96514
MEINATHYKTQKSYRFEISKTQFSTIEEITYDKNFPILSPGFMDIQINGYNGVDFNDSFDFTQANNVLIELLKNGVHHIYPTIITNQFSDLKKLGQQICEWVDSSVLAKKMVKGIHLEGPYISPKDGAKGAHALEYIKAPNIGEFRTLQDNLRQFIKIVTLSPEWKEAIPFIEALHSEVTIAIGHTTANEKEINAAVEKGACLSTHLGNGAEAVLPRHPNYIWSQLANDKLYASVIADGFHLDESILKVMNRVKGEKLILVSDAVNLAGMPAGKYSQAVGGDVTLSEEGRLFLTESPQYLAGCAKNLWQCMQYFQQHIEPNIFNVISKVTTNVYTLLQEKDPIIIGSNADFVLLDPNTFEIKASYLLGKDWC